MIRLFIVFILLHISAYAIAAEVDIKSAQSFKLFAANVLAPSSTGWKLHIKSETSVFFVRKDVIKNDTAFASFFEFPPPHDKINFLATAKKTIESSYLAFTDRLINPVYAYTEERNYPCVKASFSYINNRQQGEVPSGKSEITPTFRTIVLICHVPLYENTGLMAGFSYMGEVADLKYEAAAESFISGVKFSPN